MNIIELANRKTTKETNSSSSSSSREVAAAFKINIIIVSKWKDRRRKNQASTS